MMSWFWATGSSYDTLRRGQDCENEGKEEKDAREEYGPAVGFGTVLDPVSEMVATVNGFFACS